MPFSFGTTRSSRQSSRPSRGQPWRLGTSPSCTRRSTTRGAPTTPSAVPTMAHRDWRRPARERTEENKAKAVSFAAYRALSDLFPSQQAAFDATLAGLGYDKTDLGLDPTTPSGVGIEAAERRPGVPASRRFQPARRSRARGLRGLHGLRAGQHADAVKRSQSLAAASRSVGLEPGRAEVHDAAMGAGDSVRDDFGRAIPPGVGRPRAIRRPLSRIRLWL